VRLTVFKSLDLCLIERSRASRMNARLRRPSAGKLPYKIRVGIIVSLAIVTWALLLWAARATL